MQAQAERFLALGKTTFRDREERDEPLPEPANLLVNLKILAFNQWLARDQDEYQFEITPLGKRVAANLASALKARGIKTFMDLPEVNRALGREGYEIYYKQEAEMKAALVCDGTLLDAALEKAQREEAQAQREEAQARKAQSARAAVSPAKPVYQPHPDSVGERLKDTVAMIGMAAIVGLLIFVLVSGG